MSREGGESVVPVQEYGHDPSRSVLMGWWGGGGGGGVVLLQDYIWGDIRPSSIYVLYFRKAF